MRTIQSFPGYIDNIHNAEYTESHSSAEKDGSFQFSAILCASANSALNQKRFLEVVGYRKPQKNVPTANLFRKTRGQHDQVDHHDQVETSELKMARETYEKHENIFILIKLRNLSGYSMNHGNFWWE